MKMKTVCEKTGLTDRAVRLYIQEKLIEPVSTETYLGRKSLEFSAEDVQLLSDIAVLRRFGFSIAQIRALQTSPESARFVLENARREKQETLQNSWKILQTLEIIQTGPVCTAAEVADALRAADAAASQTKDGGEESSGLQYLRMLLTVLGLCLSMVAGVLAVILLTDMTVFYVENQALSLTAEGLKLLIKRSGVWLGRLLMAAAVAVPLGYYARILWRYGRNSRKPEIHTRAVVVDKRQNADGVVLSSFYARNGGMIDVLVFRTADGKQLELTVPQKVYYQTAIGTWGELTYQGSKLEIFTPDKQNA